MVSWSSAIRIRISLTAYEVKEWIASKVRETIAGAFKVAYTGKPLGLSASDSAAPPNEDYIGTDYWAAE
jgi:hypothetical protein